MFKKFKKLKAILKDLENKLKFAEEKIKNLERDKDFLENEISELKYEPDVIYFKKLTETAIKPEKAHDYDAGYDLFADEAKTLKRGQQLKISTGIAMDIPKGFCGIVTGRSGLSSKTPLRVKTGIIDHGYTGDIHVMLDFNRLTGIDGIYIKKGAKIAQLLIVPIVLAELVEVDSLPDYERGADGFGSTGK